MVMFQIKESKSFLDAACAPEQFDTFFLKKSVKNWGGAGQKTILGGGLLTPSQVQTGISQLL